LYSHLSISSYYHLSVDYFGTGWKHFLPSRDCSQEQVGHPWSRRQVTSVNIWHIRSMSHASCSICSGYPIRAARAHATYAWLICDSRKRLATLGISRSRFSSFAVAVPLVGNSRVTSQSTRDSRSRQRPSLSAKRIKLFFFSIVTELYIIYISQGERESLNFILFRILYHVQNYIILPHFTKTTRKSK